MINLMRIQRYIYHLYELNQLNKIWLFYSPLKLLVVESLDTQANILFGVRYKMIPNHPINAKISYSVLRSKPLVISQQVFIDALHY